MDVSDYGKGDNSTTDRMYYEDALLICKLLENLRTPLTSRISVEAVRAQIQGIVKKSHQLEDEHEPY